MQTYLALLSIGPVQSFISQARKLQDLHAGSCMLSHFACVAATWLRERGAGVIFPAVDLESAPNRILFTVSTEEASSVSALCKGCEDNLRKEFLRFCEEQIQSVPRSNLVLTLAVRAQLEPFLQVYWAAVSLGDDYEVAYQALLMRLGAAKALRVFQQLKEPSARKCSVTGQRNALFSRVKLQNLSKNRQFLPEERIEYLKDNEALSAIAFVKRCFGVSLAGFPSTRLIAKGIPFPTQDDLKRDDDDESERYYAILCFDGDRMGEHYSACGSAEAQATLSEKLKLFVREAEEYVKHKTRGRLIYAGGEDFLGFFPLKDAFAALLWLRKKFVEMFCTEKITFSAGLVFAHCKAPLGTALQCCREMERLAKDKGRNALAVAAIKHSGSIETAWLRFDKCLREAVASLYDAMFVKKSCSANFVYSLLQEFQPLLPADEKGFNHDFGEMFLNEGNRWLIRSLSEVLSEVERIALGSQLKDDFEKICIGMEQIQSIRLLRILAFVARNGAE